MDSADVDFIMKMQRHLREHLEMLQNELNKFTLNAEIASRYNKLIRELSLIELQDIYSFIVIYGL